jgi:hypothetical protein
MVEIAFYTVVAIFGLLAFGLLLHWWLIGQPPYR